MRIFGTALSVFCALIVANCAEPQHHIDQRILETQGKLNTSIENGTIVLSSSTDNLTTIEPINNSSDAINLTSTPLPSSDEEVGTSVTRMHVNITALLRNNDNTGFNPNLVQNTSSPVVIATNNETSKQSKAFDSGPIDTEVDDLLNHNSQESQEAQGPLYERQQHPVDSLEPIHFPDKVDTETEPIEDGENTEDELRILKNAKLKEEDRSPAVPLAVILVSVFVTLSVLSYAGLLLWRKYLEDRYGSRTLLVDAEEFAEPADLKHFTI